MLSKTEYFEVGMYFYEMYSKVEKNMVIFLQEIKIYSFLHKCEKILEN